MKKVLLISNAYPSPNYPHVVSYIQNIYECLLLADFDVVLVVRDTNHDNNIFLKIASYAMFYLKLSFFKRINEIDIVYINHYPHCFFPLILKYKSIQRIYIHWHGDDVIPKSKFAKYLNQLSYLFLPIEAKHIVPSLYFKEIVRCRLTVEEKDIFISPSGGVNENVFKKTTDSISTKQIINLGFASHLLKSKGMDFVYQLLVNVNNLESQCDKKIRLHIIKYGKEKKYWIDKLIPFSKFVVAHEPYKPIEMVNYYNNIDILLFPTEREAESLGLVAIEAMFCNRPVVAPASFALPEYIIDGVTGEKYKKGNYQSFEEMVFKIITNLPNYEPYKFIRENYSREVVIWGYKKIFI